MKPTLLKQAAHGARTLKKYVTNLGALCAGVAACLLTANLSHADAPFKIGFIYVGPVGDHGWTYQHDQGRLAVEKTFGDKVKTSYVENVAEGADAERVIAQMARSGHDLIFTTSFGFMNPTLKVAKKFPNVVFEHATGYKQAKNMSTYIGRTYEGRYVSGYVAANMTKTKKVGYIASFPIPEVIRDINAVKLAMNTIDPSIELKIVWVSTWYDPAKEADAASSLIDQGVDVILQHTDSPAALQAAERRGVYAVGQASDMSHFAPNAHLLSVVDDWAAHYIATTKAVMDGTWKPRDHWGGMDEDMIIIPDFNKAIPAPVVAKAKQMIADIKAGTLHPFTGPIYDQAGNVKVKAGEVISHGDMAGMDWYVQGIEGSIPK